MTQNKKRVFTINYVMKDLMQMVLSATTKKPITVVEGSGALLPDLERQIRDMKPGEKKAVTVRVVHAYGHPKPELIYKFDRKEFAKFELKYGQFLQIEELNGLTVRVAEINDTHVFLDANHPLAGRDLYFDIEMIENRPATDQEFTAGKASTP